MLQQPTSAASGPRGSRQGGRLPSGRIQNRGGIQKRNATPTRVDKDGDAVMGSASGNGRGRGSSIRGSAQGRRHGTPESLQARVSTRSNRSGIDPSAIQKAVLRGMSVSDVASAGTRGGIKSSRNRDMDKNKGEGWARIKVLGLKNSKAASNQDGGVSDLIGFIERKATHLSASAIKIKKSRLDGDALIISVQPDDASAVLRLNEYQFAGTVLGIELLSGGGPPTQTDHGESSQTIDILKTVLSRRYNPDAKLLDLSSLGADPDLVKMGMFDTTSRESKFFPALMKVCDTNFASSREKEDAVISVSLANNALTDIRSVTALAQTFPALKNLDLSANLIKDLGGLDGWRWKFRKLEHLLLTGNPIETNEPQYKNDLRRWYPNLLLLNNEQIRTPEEVLAATKEKLPLPILGPSFRDEASIAENFVKQFFPAYDSDRSSLASGLYDAQSTFSLSINTSAPRDESEQASSWDQYIKRSRNLTKLTHTSAQMSRLYVGPESIRDIFITLPVTRHPDLLSEPQKWCIECHTIPGLPDPTGQSASGVGGLIVVIHGEFSEIDVSTGNSKAMRSFDRTFILGPGSGVGGIRIASDIMVLRAYGGHDAWKPQDIDPSHNSGLQPINIPNQATIPEGFGVPAPGKTDEQTQKEMLAAELSKATGMTLEYSGLCLEQSGWNLEGAAKAFEEAKANLPPEAFAR